MSWFEEWFDSSLYEKLYSNRNFSEAAVLADLIERVIPVSEYPSILDLGCGRGRHSITLAKRGYNVTGIDLSRKALQKAKDAAKREHLDNVQFHIRDMRNPIPHVFDAIVNLFTTFGYFLEDRENERIIQSTAKMLKPNGILFLDYLNPPYVEQNLIPSESGTYDDLSFQITRKIEDGMVYKTIQFTGPSLAKPVTYTERVKLYNTEWFRNVFESTGFKLIQTYGDYSGGEYRDNAERQILIARHN